MLPDLALTAPHSAAGALDVEVVDSESRLDALRDEWSQLVEAVDLPSPFQSWEWHRAWWRHFGKPRGDRLRLALFREQGKLVGILPFVERRHLSMLIELCPIGWRDRLTEQLELIVAAAERQRVLEALEAWLAEQAWTWVCLPQMRAGDTLSPGMSDRILQAEPQVFEHHLLPETWEILDRNLNKSMRDNVRYYPRLMAREGHPFSLEIASSPDEIAAALPVLWDLHAARATANTSIRHLDYLKPANRRAFLSEVLPALASRGEARIGVLRVRGEAIATQMWLEKRDVVFLYYSGFLPSWSKYSVAMVCTSEIFKDAMGRGIRRVEFLRGSNQWKSRWGTEKRTEQELIVTRRPGVTRVHFAWSYQWRQQRRRIVRHLPWRPPLPE